MRRRTLSKSLIGLGLVMITLTNSISTNESRNVYATESDSTQTATGSAIVVDVSTDEEIPEVEIIIDEILNSLEETQEEGTTESEVEEQNEDDEFNDNEVEFPTVKFEDEESTETATGSAIDFDEDWNEKFPEIEFDEEGSTETATGSALDFDSEKEKIDYEDFEPIIKICQITGTVQPVTMMDITISLSGPSFRIDESREFVGNTTTITSNCNFPVDVYVACISGITGDEPAIVSDDFFTKKEWDNLSEMDSMSYIALSLNGRNLEPIYNNFEMDKEIMLKVGKLKSAFRKEQQLKLVPSALHGKKFNNEDEITLDYELIFEFRIP